MCSTPFALVLLGSLAGAQEPPSALKTAAPVVIRTTPVAGTGAVDPGLSEIRVTFSKKMKAGSWSWSTAWKGSSPDFSGRPRYLEDGRTCVAKVKLKPGRTYGFWLNSQRFTGFQDLAGRAAVPYLLVFRTAVAAIPEPVAADREPVAALPKGHTLVTDYGNTRVVLYDALGKVVWKMDDLNDPLDAELTRRGTLLVTEQGDNAVREYDRDGEKLWEFRKLSRPLDADELPNGNILITDPGNFRVIEVNRRGKIVWSYGRKEAASPRFKPYDADRLANGNTLIADYLGERVIEVSPKGKIVWSHEKAKYVCDADRLANGNTLITQRQPSQVFEVTPDKTIVWRRNRLQLPWDADRLPDGTTMIAENFGVRVYDVQGKVVRKFHAEWASEANRVGAVRVGKTK